MQSLRKTLRVNECRFLLTQWLKGRFLCVVLCGWLANLCFWESVVDKVDITPSPLNQLYDTTYSQRSLAAFASFASLRACFFLPVGCLLLQQNEVLSQRNSTPSWFAFVLTLRRRQIYRPSWVASSFSFTIYLSLQPIRSEISFCLWAGLTCQEELIHKSFLPFSFFPKQH